MGPPPAYEELSVREETSSHVLNLIAMDFTLSASNNRLEKNCRNISDEVFPGIHLGDK